MHRHLLMLRLRLCPKLLREHGYQSRGFEVMYNGHTGKKLMAQVFFGPTYYQRLETYGG